MMPKKSAAKNNTNPFSEFVLFTNGGRRGIRKEPGEAWRRNSERRSYADCASVTISIPEFAAKRRARQYAIQKQEHAGACSFLYRFKPELVALAEGEGFEPPDACTSTVFKTAAFDRSASLP